MVQVDKKMLILLNDRELKFYQQALNDQNTNEISHWQKVAKSREKTYNRNDTKRLG